MIGETIKTRMKELNLTQAKLAQEAGISQAALSNIINGKSSPSCSTAESLAKALQLQPADLLPLAEGSQSPSESLCCLRCGSRSVMEFRNHGSGAVRLSCGFCGLDTGEQRDRETALKIFDSYASKLPAAGGTAELRDIYVYSVAELLDSSAFDADDVRPVWFENRGLFFAPALLSCGVAEREKGCVRVLWFGAYNPKSYEIDRYGKTWRCWNKKPTMAISDSIDWAE